MRERCAAGMCFLNTLVMNRILHQPRMDAVMSALVTLNWLSGSGSYYPGCQDIANYGERKVRLYQGRVVTVHQGCAIIAMPPYFSYSSGKSTAMNIFTPSPHADAFLTELSWRLALGMCLLHTWHHQRVPLPSRRGIAKDVKPYPSFETYSQTQSAGLKSRAVVTTSFLVR